ncbi:MAG: outer membrane protein assembly factor BamD, partial [Zetaproteobacteria bacterium]|nr:outer membrane protein assembly factor BamD [Zetaproteobacteria bacterium]
PKEAYIYAKGYYDDGNFRMAITKLGEFRSRFPYSQYATEADFLIADAHFQMEEYAMASAEYAQLVKLHPKHPKIDFARFRIGLSYWEAAPENIDREQEFARKAIEAWEEFAQFHPQSALRDRARELMGQGRKRIRQAEEFVAMFYEKQEVWHACAFRYESLYAMVKDTDTPLAKTALLKSAKCLDKLADEEEEAKQDGETLRLNVYTKVYTVAQIRDYSRRLVQDASKLKP